MIKLNIYNTNLGIFLQHSGLSSNLENSVNVKINGVFAKDIIKSSRQGFYFLKDILTINKYETLKKGAKICVGYTLKISSIANDEIPLNLSPEDVESYYDDDSEEIVWKHRSELQGLYKPVHVDAEDEWVNQEFEVTVLRSIIIENYEEPIKTTVTKATNVVQKVPYGSSNILADIVQYEELEKLLTPEFLLHERPCALSSSQVFQIIRQYVKENINPKTARITSDYDFCFTVKKVVKVKPYTTKSEVKKQNGRSYSTPKYKTIQTKERLEEIFEIAPKMYNSYSVAPQWNAESLKDMAEQVRVYLEELMSVINSDTEECPHCSGCGIIKENI